MAIVWLMHLNSAFQRKFEESRFVQFVSLVGGWAIFSGVLTPLMATILGFIFSLPFLLLSHSTFNPLSGMTGIQWSFVGAIIGAIDGFVFFRIKNVPNQPQLDKK